MLLTYNEIHEIYLQSTIKGELMEFPCKECGTIVNGLTHPSMQKVLINHFNELCAERLKHVIKTRIADHDIL